MTAAGIKNLDKFLKINIFIENLNICGNSIKDEGFFILSKGLNNNQSLYKLNISNNDIHSKGLSQGLNLINICKLYSLNMSNNPILDEGLKRLTDSLKNFNNLHKLNISNCGFEFPGFEHLMNALQFIKRIEYLNVSGNNIKSQNFENSTHLVLDGLEIILSYCLGKYEVVVASVIDLWSDGILNFLSVKLDHCLGEDMRH